MSTSAFNVVWDCIMNSLSTTTNLHSTHKLHKAPIGQHYNHYIQKSPILGKRQA